MAGCGCSKSIPENYRLIDPLLTHIIHERFCSNRRSAATTSLRPAGSPLRPSTYCTSTHRVLTPPRAGLATRLSNFTTNRHEPCGLPAVAIPCSLCHTAPCLHDRQSGPSAIRPDRSVNSPISCARMRSASSWTSERFHAHDTIHNSIRIRWPRV